MDLVEIRFHPEGTEGTERTYVLVYVSVLYRARKCKIFIN